MIVKSTTFKLLLPIADFLRGWNKLTYRKDMSMLLDKKVTNYRNCGKCHKQYSRVNLLNKSYSTSKKKISIPLSKIKPKHLRWHLIFFKKNKRLSITKKNGVDMSWFLGLNPGPQYHPDISTLRYWLIYILVLL